ncbi:UNVERIFIED_CONTAM: Acyl-CoA thioesterase 2 [Sesamum latifolium]|uniref:Acyl-CoA thioesterase 2 n=1 Tax=Sesamum latifolium TaxID=2727402 RepID=A0AAW2U8H1_9LAMI
MDSGSDQGDYIVREGEAADGIYFIWEGEAEVCGSFHPDDKNRPEYHLKQFDCFGHGMVSSSQPADVIALSKVTCLVLPNEHANLLKPKSIWSADETQEKLPLVERILHLDPVDALAAACKTVDCLKIVHSLHAHFLLIGDFDIPIIYQVHRVRDGKSFATRRVEAIQKGNVVFTLLASFQKEEEGFDHQVATMPSVPDPETLLSMEELRERRLIDPRLPRTFRNKVASVEFVPWPIEIRFCEPNTSTNQTKSPPSLRYWFRARGKLSDEQALHRCVVAYASDLIFLQISLNPHREKGLKSASVSLDHAMWFHRPFRADDWLLLIVQMLIVRVALLLDECLPGKESKRKNRQVQLIAQRRKQLFTGTTLLVHLDLHPEPKGAEEHAEITEIIGSRTSQFSQQTMPALSVSLNGYAEFSKMAGWIIPLDDSNLSILAIYSFILFKITGSAEALLEIFCLRSRIFSASSGPSVADKPMFSIADLHKQENLSTKACRR